MSNNLRIDSHKLMFHLHRVSLWLEGKRITPIYIEISPSGSCNQRCLFCALDFMRGESKFIKTEMLKKTLLNMGSIGVKAIMYGGEGEPLLHKDIAEIIINTRLSAIHVALTTNGVLLPRIMDSFCLQSLSWIKVSVNAGYPETYAHLHGAKIEDLGTVLTNIDATSFFIKKWNSSCSLGVQMILLPENENEVIVLAKLAKNFGAHYFVVKPYSQHPLCLSKAYEGTAYDEHVVLKRELKSLDDKNFTTIFRDNAMQKVHAQERGYDRCLALPFWAYIDSAGNVWGCSMFLEDPRFLFGNIYDNDFNDILTGNKYKACMDMMNDFDVSKCRKGCRMDEINLYLWELKHPKPHVNFI